MARPEFNIGVGTEYIDKTRVCVVPKPEQPLAPRSPIKKADVFISNINGGQRKIEGASLNEGAVMVPGEWISLTVPDKPDLSKINSSDTDGSVPSKPEDLPWSWVHKYENGLPCAA